MSLAAQCKEHTALVCVGRFYVIKLLNSDLNNFVKCILVFQKLLISWNVHTQQAPEFTQSSANNKKHPVVMRSVERNVLLMRAVRGEQTDWFEQPVRQPIERVFQNQPYHNTTTKLY